MSATIPTMQDHWREYRDTVYPGGIQAQQNKETHQAFFAGAMVVFTLLRKISNDIPGEDAAVLAVAKLEKETLEINQRRAQLGKERN